MKVFPPTAQSARANRAFLSRVVRYLAADAGVRQFLDIGTGLPCAENVHEVAQAIAPESRIVYADNDPFVLLHARTLLTSSPGGATDYLDADLREQNPVIRFELRDRAQAGAARTEAAHGPEHDMRLCGNAEVSVGYQSVEELDELLPAMDFEREQLPYVARFAAGKAFLRYRHDGGDKRSPMPASADSHIPANSRTPRDRPAGSIVPQQTIVSYIRRPYRYVPIGRSTSLTAESTSSSGSAQSNFPSASAV
jgi:S-adenosyl methyltransferase